MRIGLEPRVEHVTRGSAQEPKCRRKTVILPKPLADRRELTQPAQSLRDVAQNEIGRRGERKAAEDFGQAADLRLIGGIARRILGAEFRDFTSGAAFPGEQIATIRKRQKILRAAFDEAQSVLAQFQVVDDLGLQQADGVGGDRVAESGMEFLRHAGAANDVTPLKDADVQSGHPQIGRAGEAVMAAANDDRVEIGHCLLKSRQERLTCHFRRSLWDRIFMALRIRSATLRAPIRSITQAR